MNTTEQLAEARTILKKLLDRNGIDNVQREIAKHFCTNPKCVIERARALVKIEEPAVQRVAPLKVSKLTAVPDMIHLTEAQYVELAEKEAAIATTLAHPPVIVDVPKPSSEVSAPQSPEPSTGTPVSDVPPARTDAKPGRKAGKPGRFAFAAAKAPDQIPQNEGSAAPSNPAQPL